MGSSLLLTLVDTILFFSCWFFNSRAEPHSYAGENGKSHAVVFDKKLLLNDSDSVA